MPHSGKHGLVPTFWDVLMPWNLKSTYFSLKIIHFLSLNILYVIYVVFWIKYWNLKLPHHCILFLFTICTVSQLFWNRVCIYIQCVCVCLCLCVCVCVCVCVCIYIFFFIYIYILSVHVYEIEQLTLVLPAPCSTSWGSAHITIFTALNT